MKTKTAILTIGVLLAAAVSLQAVAAGPDGSPGRPLRVLLIPADGGTDDGTRADFKPLFDALTRSSNIHFEMRVGQSYAAVIEGMCAGLADLAWFGPTSYIAARDRGCAELLAVEVRDGSSTYFSGLFVRADSDIHTVAELRGRAVAFGSPHSASSFAYPLSILMKAGVDPLKDLSSIRLTDSHANSLMALQSGAVDAAGASFVSFERAVIQGAIPPNELRLLARSEPIPNPPMAMRPSLPPSVKAQVRDALSTVHSASNVEPSMIRGYGGKAVDRYDVSVTDDVLDRGVAPVTFIDETFSAAIIRRAGE